MFFADPVAAFTNLRRATRPGGRLASIAWRPLAQQPWLCVPGAAVARFVAVPDLADGDGMGMFSLADEARVRTLLGAAGWTAVELEPSPRRSCSPAGAPARTPCRSCAAVRWAAGSWTGPTRTPSPARWPRCAPPSPRTPSADGVRLDASVWLVTARA